MSLYDLVEDTGLSIGIVHKELLSKYDIGILIKRFNQICPRLEVIDHYKTIYGIDCPAVFDHKNKYNICNKDGITYVKLRLKDSSQWGHILGLILGKPIYIITDYQTSDKDIKDIYTSFKSAYRIPQNLMSMLEECNDLKYYYSDNERKEYLDMWRSKVTTCFSSFSEEEYKLYVGVSIDNRFQCEIQFEHYFDEGCTCSGCNKQRNIVVNKLKNGITDIGKINHLLSMKRSFNTRVNQKMYQERKQKDRGRFTIQMI